MINLKDLLEYISTSPHSASVADKRIVFPCGEMLLLSLLEFAGTRRVRYVSRIDMVRRDMIAIFILETDSDMICSFVRIVSRFAMPGCLTVAATP